LDRLQKETAEIARPPLILYLSEWSWNPSRWTSSFRWIR